ncbi:MAG: glucose-1-phosphate adenylyltransferase subunit GlgD [Oscillospiraceae bacterium]|nr:glucose-1-phosphate adenylyltransferase subunit GlgD [Oscillospiraceae bacterium]
MAGKEKSVTGIIFANMHDNTISDLTKLRTTGSVPFGGRYRMIDFPLSNMVNSGISSVGVITKSNYQSLLDHLGSGNEWDLSRKTGGLLLLPPYGNAVHNSSGLYRGRLEALANVQRFIERSTDEYVVMCDCDTIANVDFKKILNYHIQKGADITAVYGRGSYTHDELKTKTILNVNQDDLVYDVLIRPKFSKIEGEEAPVAEANVSLNMFLMSREFLLNTVRDAASRNQYNFEVDIIQHSCKELKIFGYKYEGAYSQIDSIINYHKANMELMNFEKRTAIFDESRPIYTKIRDEAPAKYGLGACVTNSLIADGCIIEGTVENCVLFRGVKIGKHATVKNSIIMQDAVIGEKCEMNHVIADKDVTLGSYRTLEGTENYPVFVDKGARV